MTDNHDHHGWKPLDMWVGAVGIIASTALLLVAVYLGGPVHV